MARYVHRSVLIGVVAEEPINARVPIEPLSARPAQKTAAYAYGVHEGAVCEEHLLRPVSLEISEDCPGHRAPDAGWGSGRSRGCGSRRELAVPRRRRCRRRRRAPKER